MNIDNKLDALKKIKQVEAPPFLLTRIKQQIQNRGNAPAPVKWKWAFAATAFIILALNMSILFRTGSAENKTGIEAVVKSMNISDSNDLYNE